MTTTFESPSLLSNVMRTMPYTMYIATGSYAIIFGSGNASWFLVGQFGNECVVHVLKKVLQMVAGKDHVIVRRPSGAADSGIYPQHNPTASTSSGMPSGHSQMSAFAASVLSHEVWIDAGCEHLHCTVRPVAAAVASVSFLWVVAALVMTSRTRHGGILAVRVHGKIIAQHSTIQVIVGAAFGGCLGEAAAEWQRSRPIGLWMGTAVVVFLLTVLAVKLDSGKVRRTSSDPQPGPGQWGHMAHRGDSFNSCDASPASWPKDKGAFADAVADAARRSDAARSDEDGLYLTCDGIELQSIVIPLDEEGPITHASLGLIPQGGHELRLSEVPLSLIHI